MVSHTGVLAAAVKAVETLDVCLSRVLAAARATSAQVLITADHGNCEQMFDPASIRCTHPAHHRQGATGLCRTCRGQCARRRALRDIAPTLLAMMGLPQPAEMTGRSLLVA